MVKPKFLIIAHSTIWHIMATAVIPLIEISLVLKVFSNSRWVVT